MTEGRKQRLSLKSKGSLLTKSKRSAADSGEDGILPESKRPRQECSDSSSAVDQGKQPNIGLSSSTDNDVVICIDSDTEGFTDDKALSAIGKNEAALGEASSVDEDLQCLRQELLKCLTFPLDTPGRLPKPWPAPGSERTCCRNSKRRESTLNTPYAEVDAKLPPLPRPCRYQLSSEKAFLEIIKVAEKVTQAENEKERLHFTEVKADDRRCKPEQTLSNKRPLFHPSKENHPTGSEVPKKLKHSHGSAAIWSPGHSLARSSTATERPKEGPGSVVQQAGASAEGTLASSQVMLVSCCPLCQEPFPDSLDQVGRDSHIAACLATADDDDAFDDLL